MPQTPNPIALAAALADFLNNASTDERDAFTGHLGVEAAACCPQGALLLTLALADATAHAAEGASIAAQEEVEGAEDRLANAPRSSVNDHRPDGDDERDEARNDLQLARAERRLADRSQKRAELIARKIRDEVPE
jgi:hypothetical protein